MPAEGTAVQYRTVDATLHSWGWRGGAARVSPAWGDAGFTVTKKRVAPWRGSLGNYSDDRDSGLRHSTRRIFFSRLQNARQGERGRLEGYQRDGATGDKA